MSKPIFLLLHTRNGGQPVLVNLGTIQSIQEIIQTSVYDTETHQYVPSDARPNIRVEYTSGTIQDYDDVFEHVQKVIAYRIGIIAPPPPTK